MNPHKLFLAVIAASIPLTAATFLKDTSELTDMFSILGVIGSAIIVVLVLTKRYWGSARRVSG